MWTPFYLLIFFFFLQRFDCDFKNFEGLGGQLTGAGEMKEEAEVKSLDRPSMLLLLFW